MIVKELIRQLLEYPMDAQVCDTDGSPIVYTTDVGNLWCKNGCIRLEPKSQTDVSMFIKGYFEEKGTGNLKQFTEYLKNLGFTEKEINDAWQEL